MSKRPIRIAGDVAYITLTKGYEAVIDAADVHIVEPWSWYAYVAKSTVYAVRMDCSSIKKRQLFLHRVLVGEPLGLQVDHISVEGLDNRRANLRIATHQQNNHNHRISKNNTSGFKGVTWFERSKKWMAQIHMNGKKIHLGLHGTPEAAHAAYAAASAKLHGEFGRTA